MRPDGNVLRPAWFIAAVLLGGLGLRLAVATMGSNYDFASWSLVADIAERGGNVYAETARYNYGPVWLEVLRVLGRLSQGSETALHLLVAGLLGLVVLGLSLMAKHVLFAFPLWLAVKQKGLGSRLAVLLLPPAVFAAGFLPYWREGRAGIVANVFRYASRNQEYFSSLFVPGIVRSVLSGRAVWLAALLVFVAVYPGPFTLLYTVVATFHLLVDADGLHVGYGPGRDLQYGALVTLLVLAIVHVTWGDELMRAWRSFVRRIRSGPGPERQERGGGA